MAHPCGGELGTAAGPPSRTAVVARLRVSLPLVGSVTPKACRRKRPAADLPRATIRAT